MGLQSSGLVWARLENEVGNWAAAQDLNDGHEPCIVEHARVPGCQVSSVSKSVWTERNVQLGPKPPGDTRVTQTMSLKITKDSSLPPIPVEDTPYSSSPTSFHQAGDQDDYQPPHRPPRAQAISPTSGLPGNGVHSAEYSNGRTSRDQFREEQFIQQPQPPQRPSSQQGMLMMNHIHTNGDQAYYEPPRRPGSQASMRPYPPGQYAPPNQYYDQQSMRRGSPQLYPPSTTIDARPSSTDPDPFYAQGMQTPMYRGNPSPSVNNVPLPRAPSPPILDQSHLHPGEKASLLSHEQTLALYRSNAKRTSDPDLIFEFAVFMLEASKSLAITPADLNNSNQLEIERAQQKQEGLVKEALALLKRIADRGHVLAQYTLADCYANGIGTVRGKQDFDRAFPLFILAAKHGHVDACYRAGTCCENGWGCRRDSAKAVQFFRKAGAAQHPGAMYRLGLAELNGELGLSKNAREGVKWLKRSAEHATAEFPHALHELALCHEKGIDNVVFVDNDYAAELFGQAAELGYAPSAHRLGECYEYGRMGCPQDPALSIHYYVSDTRPSRDELLTNKPSRAEHRCSAKSPRRLFRIDCLVPCRLAWRPPAVRHGSLSMGETSSRCRISQGNVRSRLFLRNRSRHRAKFARVCVTTFCSKQLTGFCLSATIYYKRAAEKGDKRAIQRLRGNTHGPLPEQGGAPGVLRRDGDSGEGNKKDCIIM